MEFDCSPSSSQPTNLSGVKLLFLYVVRQRVRVGHRAQHREQAVDPRAVLAAHSRRRRSRRRRLKREAYAVNDSRVNVWETICHHFPIVGWQQ